MKLCIKCGENKGVGEFGVRRIFKDGLNRVCRVCRNAKQAEWTKASPDKAKAIALRSKSKRTPEKAAETARKWHRNNRARAAELKRNRTCGITTDQYQAMLSAQNGKCAIGNHDFGQGRRTFVDHDHRTGRVRGILCPKHNMALGLLGDSSEGIYAAMEYINRPVALGLSEVCA